ncbi:MAG TPA: Rab family GTPase [Bryobacteraceae bacterium]|nr:Rab family GTPase [Bryobacteraceae bacterium]
MIKKKICMVGSFGVGKTSLVKRFVESIFGEQYLTTVGVKIDKKDVVVDGCTVTLAIWDIAGEDDLAEFRISNVRGASGYVLVVDGCRRASLEKAVDLQRRITASFGLLPFVLVANKADLRDEWEIQPDAIAALIGEGWHAIEASAKTGDAVEQVFHTLAKDMLDRDASRVVEGDEE